MSGRERYKVALSFKLAVNPMLKPFYSMRKVEGEQASGAKKPNSATLLLLIPANAVLDRRHRGFAT